MTAPTVNDPFPVAPKPASVSWEDAIDIFYAPSSVFERRRDGRFWLALLILCVLAVGVAFLSSQLTEAVFDAEFRRRMAEQPTKMTPEQMESARSMAAKIQSFSVYLMPVIMTVGAMMSGLIIWIIGLGMGAKLRYGQAVTVAVFSSFPEMLGRALAGAQGLFLDVSGATSQYSFALSAARFLPDGSSKWLLKLASLGDPFVLWGAFLIFLGSFIIGKMEKEKAAVLAIIHTLLIALAR